MCWVTWENLIKAKNSGGQDKVRESFKISFLYVDMFWRENSLEIKNLQELNNEVEFCISGEVL